MKQRIDEENYPDWQERNQEEKCFKNPVVKNKLNEVGKILNRASATKDHIKAVT